MRIKRATECMLKVLKATPGVNDAKAGETTSPGATYPYVEYRAAERASWTTPTRFTLVNGWSKHGIVFMADLPGLTARECPSIRT